MKIKLFSLCLASLLLSQLSGIGPATAAADGKMFHSSDATRFFLDQSRFPVPPMSGIKPIAEPRTVSVGDTEAFWAYGFGFFVGYYYLSATCQKITGHSYIYTEDPRVNRVTVHPGDPDLLVAVGDDGPYKSVDGGATWVSIATEDLPDKDVSESHLVTPQNRAAVYDAVFPSLTNTDLFFIGTDNGCYKTTNGGGTWRLSSTAIPQNDDNLPPRVNDLLIDPGDRNLMYAATDAGVFVTDRAQSSPVWQNVSKGLPVARGGDWGNIICYRVVLSAGDLVIGTEAGLFKGKLRKTGSVYSVDWLPFVGSTIGSVADPHAAVSLAEPQEAVSDADSLVLVVGNADHTHWVSVDQGAGPERRWRVQPYKGVGADEESYLVKLKDESLVIGDPLAGGYDLLTVAELSARSSEADPRRQRYLSFAADDSDGEPVPLFAPINVSDGGSGALWATQVLAGSGAFKGKRIALLTGDNLYYAGSLDTAAVSYTNLALDGLTVRLPSHPSSNIVIGDVVVNGTTIAAAANRELLISTDSGATWSATGSQLGEALVHGLALDDAGVVYAATDSGIYRSASPGGPFARVSGAIGGFQIDARAVTPAGSGVLYAGAYFGGVLKSDDNGLTWTPVNTGLARKMVTAAEIDDLAVNFESSTPADQSKGIYELTQDWFGPIPDMDSDPHVTLLILDIDDSFYLAAGDATAIDAYFSPVNQFAKSDSLYGANSNAREMICIDSDPLDLSEAAPVLAHQMQHLSHYNSDPDEEHWLNEGLSELAEFLLGYTSPTKSFTFPMNLSLTDWGKITLITTDLNEHANNFILSYLMALYLYEQYFTEPPSGSNASHKIRALVANSENGIESVDQALAAAGYSKSFSEIFDDWAVAAYLDIVDPDVYGGRYGFRNARVSVSGQPIEWGYAKDPGSPYPRAVPHWGTNYWRMKANLLDNPNYEFGGELVFNGDDANRFGIQLIRNRGTDPAATSVVDAIPLNERQVGDTRVLGGLDFGPEGGTNFFAMVMAVTCKSDSGVSPAPLAISDDLEADEITVGIAQNPILSQFIELYIFTNERIFEDGGQLFRRTSSPEVETPIVWIYSTDDTTRLPAEIVYESDQDGDYVYRANYLMKGSAALDIRLSGEDPGGNRITASTTVQARPISRKSGGMIASTDGVLSLSVPPGALERDVYLALQRCRGETPPGLYRGVAPDPRLSPAGDIYCLSPGELDLKLPARLVLKGPVDSNEPVGLFRWSGERWEAEPFERQPENGRVVAEVRRLGAYRLYRGEGAGAAALPLVFDLGQNYPNPFNPETAIAFQIPNDGRVELDIYNSVGQLVRRLVDESRPAGRYRVVWDGRDNAGRPAASGVYYYRLRLDDRRAVRKMVLLK